MRTALENIQKIDAYIANDLSQMEMSLMKESLAQSPELNAIYQNQLLIQQAIQRKAILAQVEGFSGGSSLSFWSKFKGPIILSATLIGILGIIGIVLALTKSADSAKTPAQKNLSGDFGFKNKSSESKESIDSIAPKNKTVASKSKIINAKFSEYQKFKPIKPSMIETKRMKPNGLNTWATPEVQTFQINPVNTNTLECKEGTVIIVPANAVLDKNGKKATSSVSMEIIEALTIDKMIAYNLTTTNGDKMLTSGGMLYMQPYVAGEKGSFDKDTPCHIEIPTDEFDGNMSTWKGVVDKKGNIEWKEPEALENYLIPVDFSLIEFLPTGFRSHFQSQLPFENYKKSSVELEDSVYYSLGKNNNFEVESINNKTNEKKAEQNIARPILSQPFEFPVKIDSKENISTLEYAVKIKNYKPNMLSKDSIIIIMNNKKYSTGIFIDGSAKINLPRKSFFKVTVKLQTKNCGEITLDDIVVSADKITILDLHKHCPNLLENLSESKISPTCYINPSTIKTIRQPKFMKTFIATREFEERLALLHKMKNGEELLELYINNLDKNLFEIDQMVADKIIGTRRLIFQNLANQKLTNVKLDLANLKDIQAYYQASRLKFHNEAKENDVKMNAKALSELNKLDKELAQVQKEYFSHYHKNLPSQELSASIRKIPQIANMRPVKPSVSNNTSYKISWNNTGWMNIDAYLRILTNGEKIISISANENSKDERVYQCINSLKTVVGLTNQSGKYEGHYPSNTNPEKIKFNATYIVGISRNENQISFASAIFNANEVSSVILSWQDVTEEELLEKLKTLSPNNDRLAHSISDEREKVKHAQIFQAKQTAIVEERKKIIAKKEKFVQFIQGLINFINPCYNSTEPLQIMIEITKEKISDE